MEDVDVTLPLRPVGTTHVYDAVVWLVVGHDRDGHMALILSSWDDAVLNFSGKVVRVRRGSSLHFLSVCL